ncbi:hypothetical protein SUGI_0002550 [Cryptomeria japonica]|uniref:oligoribonuclease n=1 Tax=Cryptomeria japonica TaxID=3369 RepID=UPI0024089E9F|nr:oligoribonuclease [Cryptomeria japonica]GLJ04749.1 hypothetical protein SUGI_0002550 [Cryptomeria japonica]
MNNISNSFAALSLDSSDPREDCAQPNLSTEKGRKMTKKERKKASITRSNRPEENNSDIQSKQQVLGTSLSMPLVWIDLEMTGLRIEEDRILEIACIITDGRLVKRVEGPDLIINQSDQCLARMGEWCQNQHSASGLVDAVRKSRVTEQEAEQQVLEFVKQHISTTPPPLAGNSVYVDFMFLKKYMPNLAAFFSHILVDVSSIKALCFRWYPKDAKNAPVKKKTHRALDDIKESIAELEYLQKTIFKASQR